MSARRPGPSREAARDPWHRPLGPAALALTLALAFSFTAAPSRAAVIAAAGDIACAPTDPSYNGGLGTATECRMKDTSDLAVAGGYDAVILLGDNQYDNGLFSEYTASYDPTWGRVKSITRPVPGNHEYNTPGAVGYYQYFGAAAGDPAKGYYSFDLGGWHVVVLNSSCAAIGGCQAGSPQETWLRADLAAHPGVCTLAVWHQPRFSSGPHGDDPAYQPFWQALYDAGADLVLNGHDHVYERFAPQSPAALADASRGIRQITVGTGGRNHTSIVTLRANSEVQNADTFGILKLTLAPTGYSWQFAPIAGQTFTDGGSALCHNRPLGFHTLPPCRVFDTRNPTGPQGGPALAANQARTFPVAGLCGVPANASAITGNLTVVAPAATGVLRTWAAGTSTPGTSALNFRTGRTRTNNAVVNLGAGALAVRADLPAGSVNVVLDVVGYFE